jgi:hypothetical protein
MIASDQKLIQRLQERIVGRERATGGRIHSRKPVPAVVGRALQVTERALGFKLPEFPRAIYLSVGNGGFGPEYGIVGTKGGAKLDGSTLETCYQDMVKLEKQNSVWRWPRRLLPLANYGCGMWSCVDCDYLKLPMILWDPNNLDAELDVADARLNWGNSFWHQGRSLRTWLEGWLTEEQEQEPKWPSHSWMKKRYAGLRWPSPVLGLLLPRRLGENLPGAL